VSLTIDARHEEADSGKAPVFQAVGLTKIYQMGEVPVHALRGVDLDLYEGELTALLGPSGSGKSTLLNILGGLDAPSTGEVRFRGRLLDAGDDAALTRYRREHVGFVFQFYNLVASLTAEENVALVTEIALDPMAPAEALAMVGLGGRLDAFPAQLSGGEQQRVAIARAFAPQPQVLFADEPTGNLDQVTGAHIIELLLALRESSGATLILVTHDAELAVRCDRRLLLDQGRLEPMT